MGLKKVQSLIFVKYLIFTPMAALACADDGMLVTYHYILKNILKLCNSFGTNLIVIFNPNKYQFLHFAVKTSNLIL